MSDLTVNGNLIVTKTLGTATTLVETTDSSSYATATVQAGNPNVNVSLATFGSTGGVGTLYDNNTAGISGIADRLFIINEQSSGEISFATGGYGASKEAIKITSNGQVMIQANGTTHPLTPSAYLHIAAGTSSAGHAPLKLTTSSTSILSTPEAGAFETDGTDLYWTNNSGIRKKLSLI